MTVTCREISEVLYDYTADVLSKDSKKEFERHLEGCVNCWRYVDSYRKVIALGGGLPDEPMPDELVRRLRSMIQELRP